MQVSGRWWECSETLKMFRPHLLMSSRSYKRQERIHIQLRYKLDKSAQFLCNWWSGMHDFTFESKSSKSVFTPKRAVLQLLDRPGPCVTFLTPLIWVISCCCLLFLSRDLGVGDGISSSFCLSTGGKGFRPWLFISALTQSIHNRDHDFTDSLSEYKSAKWSSILVKATYKNFSAQVYATAKCWWNEKLRPEWWSSLVYAGSVLKQNSNGLTGKAGWQVLLVMRVKQFNGKSSTIAKQYKLKQQN